MTGTLLWVMSVIFAAWEAGSLPTTQASQVLPEAGGCLEDMEIVIPFYEGILLRNPPRVARDTGLADLKLAYPGVLSTPFVAWRFRGEDWTAMYASSTAAVPVELHLQIRDRQVTLDLRGHAPCTIKRLQARGNWQELARSLRRQWPIETDTRPLAKDFTGVHFYVHQWVSKQDDPALRVNWTVEQLVERMRQEQPGTLQHVYGFDPGGVDLGGESCWSKDAPAKVKAVLGANPGLSHLSWLNLRTYKWAIPRLGVQVSLTPAVLGSSKKSSPGTLAQAEQFSYKQVEMCLASAQWQESRLKQFDRLADMGFKVIQLDEFPIPTRWQIVPCQAVNHLHQPGDAASEWQHTMKLLDTLSIRARRRGIRLICEEPSAALLPYTCGYIDRQYGDAYGFYTLWKKSPLAETIPLFSTMFGDLVTPYTDVDPDRQPPTGWLINRKVWPP